MRTCLICDDHAMMREALSGAVMQGWPDVTVVQADDYPSAWTAAAAGPDLILSDLTMPGSPPLEGIARLRRIAPSTPILVITGNEDDALLLALFEEGIAGFCPKTSRSAVIEAAVRLVLAGGRYLPPEVLVLAGRRDAGANARTAEPAPRRPDVRLTARQLEILRLMAEGASNKDIARLLDLSPATVKTHAAAAFAALGAANRTEAVIRARGLGLI